MLTSRIVESQQLTAADWRAISALFAENYSQPNHGYLLKSAETFRFVAIAEQRDDIVGFAFGDSLRCPLPRFESKQTVALAGIGCIADTARRQGLFTRLATEAMLAGGGIQADQPFLVAGRMAHIATYRTIAATSNSAVPVPGKPITDWHREVGHAVAELLGAKLNTANFVVSGSGQPVGYPKLAIDTSAAEQRLFAAVNRDNGDSLLTMGWMPSAPKNW